MSETTYPHPFRAVDAEFLTWSTVGDSRAALQAIARVPGDDPLPDAPQVLSAGLPFYPEWRLIAIVDAGADEDRFYLYNPDLPGETVRLCGTNEPIYELNDRHGIVLTAANVPLYIKFFFHFVRGLLGSFHIVETPDDLDWAVDADEAAKAEVADLLMPLTMRGLQPDGLFRATGSVVFKNALFKTDVVVASRPLSDVVYSPDGESGDFTLGQAALTNEDLLVEDLPVNLR